MLLTMSSRVKLPVVLLHPSCRLPDPLSFSEPFDHCCSTAFAGWCCAAPKWSALIRHTRGQWQNRAGSRPAADAGVDAAH